MELGIGVLLEVVIEVSLVELVSKDDVEVDMVVDIDGGSDVVLVFMVRRDMILGNIRTYPDDIDVALVETELGSSVMLKLPVLELVLRVCSLISYSYSPQNHHDLLTLVGSAVGIDSIGFDMRLCCPASRKTKSESVLDYPDGCSRLFVSKHGGACQMPTCRSAFHCLDNHKKYSIHPRHSQHHNNSRHFD